MRLRSTRQGSVIALFNVDNGQDTPGAAQNRWNELSSALRDPNSLESIQATSLGIPVLRTALVTGSDPTIPIIIGAVIGGLLFVAAIVILSIILVKRHRDNGGTSGGFRRRRRGEQSEPLLAEPLRSTSSSGGGGGEGAIIGSPFNVTHDQGESRVLKSLVPLEEAKARQTQREDALELLPGKTKQFRLIADIHDVGDAVLTGCKGGSVGYVDASDLVGGDWIWATIDNRSGWVPRNHMAFEK